MLAAENYAFKAPEGIALRYGLFYGGNGTKMRQLLGSRRLPVANGGLLGWVHHDDAAAATVASIERGKPGNAYNIVDDRPAGWREVFTTMAEAFDAPSPLNVPRWLLRLAAPYLASFAVDTSMRVSNAKARDELGWRPMFPTYRDGIEAMVSTDRPTSPASEDARSDQPRP